MNDKYYEETQSGYSQEYWEELVRNLQLQLVDEEGMVREAMVESSYDDKIESMLKAAVKKKINGHHPDLIPLVIRLVDECEAYLYRVADEQCIGEYK